LSAPSAHPDDALLSLAYGELSAAEARKVQAHLAGCAACSGTLAGYQAVRRAASALPQELPSAEGLASLLHYGAEAAARARRGRRVRSVASVLGAFATLAVVLLLATPKRPPETAALPASPAPAVGPLAEADRPLAKAQAKAFPEGLAAAKSVPALPSGAGANTAKNKSVDASRRAREVAGAADAKDEAASGVAARSAPSPLPAFAASGARGVAGGSQGASASGAAAQRTAPAPSASAPAAPRMDVALAQPALGAPPATDAGSAGEPLADEARRAVLEKQLEGATGAHRRTLLSELCALDIRLGHRADGERVCAILVQQYPGTPEASVAQEALLHLPNP